MNVHEEPASKRKAICYDRNDGHPAKNARVDADLSDAQLSSIVIDDDETIESAPAPYPRAQAGAASKVSVVFKAPMGSGRPKCGVVAKGASRACVEM